MLAYHNRPELKLEVVNEMAIHRKADTLVQSYGYWKDGKGCAVGCLIKGSNHVEYETRFGIPQMLAHLEDTIFEGLPKKNAQKWPERFLEAIKIGSDLSLIGYKFMYWNLTENLVLKDSDSPEAQKVIIQCREAIKQCADVIYPLTKGEKVDESAAESARSAAESAAESARSAAESAAESARSAAESARSAARSAESAARSAARSAWSAWSAESAESAARSAWSAESAARSAAESAAESARSAAESARSAARSAESAESAARSAWSAESAESAESAARSAAESAWSAESAESAARSAAESAWSAWSAAYIKMADKLIELIEEAV